MTYRDELQATRARADAAQQEGEAARAEARAAEGRADELARELRAAQDEAAELRAALSARGPHVAPAPAPTPVRGPDPIERALSMVALDASMEREATRARKQRPVLIAMVVITLVVAFLFLTRLYDPLFEFLLDDLWGR